MGWPNPFGTLGTVHAGNVKLGDKLQSWVGGLGERPGEREQREGLTNQSDAAGRFADVGEAGFGRMQGSLDRDAEYLRRIANGQESVSREQLRQAAEENIARQHSFAASAAPRDAAMAAFGASQGAATIGAGLAGQQAIAGLQERQAAQRALADLELARSGQYVQVGLGGRQNAIAGLNGITPGQSALEQWGGAVQSGAQLAAVL